MVTWEEGSYATHLTSNYLFKKRDKYPVCDRSNACMTWTKCLRLLKISTLMFPLCSFTEFTDLGLAVKNSCSVSWLWWWWHKSTHVIKMHKNKHNTYNSVCKISEIWIKWMDCININIDFKNVTTGGNWVKWYTSCLGKLATACEFESRNLIVKC